MFELNILPIDETQSHIYRHFGNTVSYPCDQYYVDPRHLKGIYVCLHDKSMCYSMFVHILKH